MAEDKKAEPEFRGIKLDYINTDMAAKNFAEMLDLDNNDTFFLNGTWGSGKTEFLRNTNKYCKKKFKYLKLWEVKDKKTVISLSFRTLLPKMYWILIILLIIGANGTIYTNKLNLPVIQDLDFNIFTISIFSITISYGIINSLGIKLDDIYIELLKLLPSKKVAPYLINLMGVFLFCLLVYHIAIIYKFDFSILVLISFISILFASILSDVIFLKKSVLVIDDFDRVPEERRKEAYMVFNILKDRIPIIFVGDYENIVDSNKHRYLQKIIDIYRELPIEINSSNIWANYFDKLSVKLKVKLSEEFRDIIYKSRLNLRERAHFNDYVNREFFDRNKLGHVNVEQQLLIILIFLYYRECYNLLIEEADYSYEMEEYLKARESGTDYIPDKERKFDEIKPDILAKAIKRLRKDKRPLYPPLFSYNKKAYYLYESPSNLSVSNLDTIIRDNNKLKEYMMSGYDTDFYQYLISEDKSPLLNSNQRCLDLCLGLIRDGKHSSSIGYVIRKNNNELMSHGKLKNNELFEKWKLSLKKHDFDLSMMFYFFNRYYILSFEDMGNIFRKDPDILQGGECLDHSLNVYISSRKLWRQFKKWDDKIWGVIESLSDEQFLSFWVFQGLISNGSNDFYSIPDDKTYVIFYEEHPHPKLLSPYYDIISYSETINKIKPRLSELELKGYHFKLKRGTYYEK